jgi:hypothetical protein
MSPVESAALWELYSRGEGAVAVKSTYRRLRLALSGTDEAIGIGTVAYIDYAQDSFVKERADRSWSAVLHKRRSFAHERELRAVIVREPPELPDNPAAWMLKPGRRHRLITPEEFMQEPGFEGTTVSCDAEALVESVYVAPTQPSWVRETVAAVCAAFGYSWEPIHSELDQDPVF